MDVSAPAPVESYRMLRSELLRYDSTLLERPSAVVLTKCDLIEGGVDGVDKELMEIADGTVAISAVNREGLKKLLEVISRALN